MKRSTRASSRSLSSEGDSSSVEKKTTYQKKKGKKLPPLCEPTQWVAILPEGAKNSRGGYTFIPLVDPKTGSERQYVISEEKHQIYEAQKCSDEPRSWLIGDTVQTDGSLLISNPMDPLFLALPYLTKAAKAGKFTTLEAILDDPTRGNSSLLEQYVSSEQWRHICDVKELPGEVFVYRYSQPKTINWLRKKVEALSAELQSQNVHVGSGSVSATLVKSLKNNSASKEDYLVYACGMVCEYLDERLTTVLSQEYSIKDVTKRPQQHTMNQPPAKRQRTDSVDSGLFSQQSSLDDEYSSQQPSGQELSATASRSGGGNSGPLEDYTKCNTSLPPVAPPAKKLSQAQKALAKADKKGMKSLSSFFGKTKT
ncbi:Ribonuclease H2 subunit B [Geodia barretti]|uniref:Ribonuclease H2 subunit B n=1 Tax=Geodia barretti TaxID=519541 RepID=A0AA35VVR2_GEOBA|nr:Ribonuclease H2 subunit B [Geodia barretti]